MQSVEVTSGSNAVVFVPNVYHALEYNVLCQVSGGGEVLVLSMHGWLNRDEFAAQMGRRKPRWYDRIMMFGPAHFEDRDEQLARFDAIAEAVIQAHKAHKGA